MILSTHPPHFDRLHNSGPPQTCVRLHHHKLKCLVVSLAINALLFPPASFQQRTHFRNELGHLKTPEEAAAVPSNVMVIHQPIFYFQLQVDAELKKTKVGKQRQCLQALILICIERMRWLDNRISSYRPNCPSVSSIPVKTHVEVCEIRKHLREYGKHLGVLTGRGALELTHSSTGGLQSAKIEYRRRSGWWLSVTVMVIV